MNKTAILFLILLAETTAPEPPRILLSYESTDFKKTLIEEITGLLKKDSADVIVAEHAKGELDSLDASAFDAVFVTNSGVNSKVRPWVMTWLEKHKKFSSRIVLHTTQTRNWEVIVPVDAVTSASAKKQVAKLAQEYTNRIINKIRVHETK